MTLHPAELHLHHEGWGYEGFATPCCPSLSASVGDDSEGSLIKPEQILRLPVEAFGVVALTWPMM